MPTSTDSFEWDAARYGVLPLPHIGWGRGVLERLRLTGSERVLDLGCGTGRDAAALLASHPGCRVIGVDASTAMLEAARAATAPYPGRASFLQADLRQPVHVPGTVDAVMSVATLHWIPDHVPVFASAYAALRPGGRFAAECGGAGNIVRVQKAIDDVTGTAADAWQFASDGETATRLRAAGFDEVRSRLRPDPVRFAPEAYPVYLATVILPKYLAAMDAASGAAFVRDVADAVGEPIVDYVRLEFEARR